MNIQAELLAAPKVPLRYLVRFNPRPDIAKNPESCYLPMEAISEFGGVDSSRMRPTTELAKGYSYVADGDVAYAKVTPCFENGKGLIGTGLPGGYAFATTELTVMRPSGELDGRYLAWVLQSEDFRSPGESHMSGAGGLKRVPESYAASFRVPRPGLDAQRAIADYLDRETAQIDAFVAKNEELIALLTERRAAAIELTVAPAELPLGWKSCQVRRLGPKSESGVSVNGYSIPAVDDEVGVLKTGAVSRGIFDPTENKRVIEEDLARVAAPVRGGTLIVNRANTPELVGSASYVAEDHPTLYLSDKLWQLTFESADAAYMHYWTKSDAYRSQLRGLSVGASSSMQNLSYGDFLSVWISIPPMRQQAEIVARLNRETAEIDVAIHTARRGVDLARERRAALISAAVTGKIDVGVAA